MQSLSAVIFAASLAASVQGHAYMSRLNTTSDSFMYVRQFPLIQYPIWDPNSSDMICGKGADLGAASMRLDVTAGQKMSVKFNHNNDNGSDDYMDRSHVGPCQFYLTKDTDLNNAKWFKIYEDGYSNGNWCTIKWINNKGFIDVTLPAELENGDYTFRSQFTALHEADTLWVPGGPRGAQYYAHCGDIRVTGGQGKSVSASSLFSIPGHETAAENVFNVYNTAASSYVVPGPDLVVFASSSTTSAPTTSAPTTSAPTTSAPTTSAPTTSAPTTSAPTTSTTTAPTTTSGPGTGIIVSGASTMQAGSAVAALLAAGSLFLAFF